MEPRQVYGAKSRSGRTRPSVGMVLLGLWLAARMAFVIPAFREPFRVQLIDRNTYFELANSLLDRGEYAGYTVEDLDLIRTPAYPVFIAGILTVFGRNLAFVAFFQVILTVATCALVYQTTRMVADRPAALGAAWIYALNPNSLFIALFALTETLFTTLLTLSIYLLLRYRQTAQGKAPAAGAASWRWAAGSGFVLGMGILVRPIAIWLLPLWLAFVLLAVRAATWRSRVIPALVVAALCWGAFLPWQLRNYAVHGQFSLSPVGEATIRNWMIAEGLAEAKDITREQAVAEIASASNPGLYSLQLVGEYPRAMAVATLRGIYRTLVGFEYGTWMYILDMDRKPGRTFVNAALGRNLPLAWQAGLDMARQGYFAQLGITIWALAYDLALFALAATGIFFLWQRYREPAYLALALALLAYLLLGPAGAGQARFRVPAAPSLAILGGAGLGGVRALWRARR